MLTGVFGALAEYERTLINERSAATREARRARGLNVGRPKAVTPDQARQVRAERRHGNHCVCGECHPPIPSVVSCPMNSTRIRVATWRPGHLLRQHH